VCAQPTARQVLENIRPTVIAGFAKLVDEVKKHAAPM
jgi:hypothetical protein